MNTDITFCSNREDCERAKYCQRAEWPTEGNHSFAAFDPSNCGEFRCNCGKTKFVGSNRHGNYYKCLICGEEIEG